MIRAALADAEVAPESVTLVETHGTATKLGDPIEFAALNEVFGHGTRTNPCFLGSVKSNIGHLEPASGLAGLLKVLFCLHHREDPPLAGFGAANPELDLESGPFTIPTEPLPWRADGPLRAGVSAFGMAGTNAHVCVEEYVNPDVGDSVAAHEPTRRQVLVLSGHTPAALAQRVADVERMVVEEPAVPVGALCFSAAVGREHLPHRVSVVGATTAELLERVAAGAATRRWPSGQGATRAGGGRGRPAGGRSRHELALAFVGAARSTGTAHRPGEHRRVSLPPYPFAAPRPPCPRRPASVDLPHWAGAPGLRPADASRGGAARHGVAAGPRARHGSPGRARHGSGAARTDLAGRAPVTRRGPLRRAASSPGWLSAEPTTPPAPLSIDELRSRYSRKMEPAGLYAWFAAKGMELAAPLTPIAAVSFGSSGVLAQIGQAEQSPHVRSVAAIEAALQCMAVLTLADPEASAATYLPVSIGRAAVHGDLSRAAFAHLRFAGQEHDGTRLGDATLLDAAGAVLASLDAIGYRPVSRAADAPNSRSGPASPKAHAAILELVRRVLRDPEITWDTSLSASGLDSMLAAEIAGQIGERLHAKLSPIDVLEARDCRALAAMVTGAAPPLSDEVAADRDDAGEDVDAGDVAVIGLACAMPGATSPRELWSMLAQGATAIGPPPTFRWNGHGHALGGFMDNVDEFDARFFELFPKQAEVLDPQARWLLRTTWEALESAGVAASSVPKNTGVFVGASYQHYKDYNIGPELGRRPVGWATTTRSWPTA